MAALRGAPWQALEADCWIGLSHGQRCVLAGDHLQLPPTITSEALWVRVRVRVRVRVGSEKDKTTTCFEF